MYSRAFRGLDVPPGRCGTDHAYRAQRISWGISKRNERSHRPTLQLFASLQKAQLDEEADLQNLPASLLHERRGSGGSAAGGQQVVHQQHAAARIEGVHVDGNGIGTVFQLVALLVSPVRELAFL